MKSHSRPVSANISSESSITKKPKKKALKKAPRLVINQDQGKKSTVRRMSPKGYSKESPLRAVAKIKKKGQNSRKNHLTKFDPKLEKLQRNLEKKIKKVRFVDLPSLKEKKEKKMKRRYGGEHSPNKKRVFEDKNKEKKIPAEDIEHEAPLTEIKTKTEPVEMEEDQVMNQEVQDENQEKPSNPLKQAQKDDKHNDRPNTPFLDTEIQIKIEKATDSVASKEGSGLKTQNSKNADQEAKSEQKSRTAFSFQKSGCQNANKAHKSPSIKPIDSDGCTTEQSNQINKISNFDSSQGNLSNVSFSATLKVNSEVRSIQQSFDLDNHASKFDSFQGTSESAQTKSNPTLRSLISSDEFKNQKNKPLFDLSDRDERENLKAEMRKRGVESGSSDELRCYKRQILVKHLEKDSMLIQCVLMDLELIEAGKLLRSRGEGDVKLEDFQKLGFNLRRCKKLVEGILAKNKNNL